MPGWCSMPLASPEHEPPEQRDTTPKYLGRRRSHRALDARSSCSLGGRRGRQVCSLFTLREEGNSPLQQVGNGGVHTVGLDCGDKGTY